MVGTYGCILRIFGRLFFFFNDTATTEIYTLSLHDALPILLFELPASYLVGIERWINSPGYVDGQIDFGRLIVPHCLECHGTSFPIRTVAGAARYSRDYVPGITCDKCHGDGRAHVRYQTSHPTETSGRYIL